MHIYSGQFSQNIILKGLHVPCSAVLHVDSSALDPGQGSLQVYVQPVFSWEKQLCDINNKNNIIKPAVKLLFTYEICF